MSAEIPQTPKQIAHLLGWQGPGSYTSPSYDAVVIACQRGELKARQTGSRKSRWLILPSDAIAWRSGVKPQRLRRTA